MSINNVLYHGSNIKVDILDPQDITLPREVDKLNGNTRALYATADKAEALIHAITKGRIENYSYKEYEKDHNTHEMGWSLRLPITRDELPLDTKVFLYKINPESFVQNQQGEWYTTHKITPEAIEEVSIGNALEQLDEVRFEKHISEGSINRESPEGWI